MKKQKTERGQWANVLLQHVILHIPSALVDFMTMTDLHVLHDSIPRVAQPILRRKLYGAVAQVRVTTEPVTTWVPIAVASNQTGRCRVLELTDTKHLPSTEDWTRIFCKSSRLQVLRLIQPGFQHSLSPLKHISASLHTLIFVAFQLEQDTTLNLLSIRFPNLKTLFLGLRFVPARLAWTDEQLATWIGHHNLLEDVRLCTQDGNAILQSLSTSCPALRIVNLSMFNMDTCLPSSLQDLVEQCPRLEHVQLKFGYGLWSHDLITNGWNGNDDHVLCWFRGQKSAELMLGTDLTDSVGLNLVKAWMLVLASRTCTWNKLQLNLANQDEARDVVFWLLDRFHQVAYLELIVRNMHPEGIPDLWDTKLVHALLTTWPTLVTFSFHLDDLAEFEAAGGEYPDGELCVLLTQSKDRSWTMKERRNRFTKYSSRDHWERVLPAVQFVPGDDF